MYAQCPTILTDDPIEVCESGGTTINVAIEGDFFSVNWSPAIGLSDENISNPIAEFPTDTTYLLTVKGIDANSGDTCMVQKAIEIKVVRYELLLAQDTVHLPCGDSIRLQAEVIPNGSFFIMEWETEEGHILKGEQTLNPLVNQTGQYEANVIGNLGRIVCRDKASVFVTPTNADKLLFTPPEKLGCGQNEVTLSLENQEDTADYQYQWTTVDGKIITDSSDPFVIVNELGEYSVTRTNLLGQCATSAAAQVAEKIPFSNLSLIIQKPDCKSLTGEIGVEELEGGTAPYQFSIDGGINFQTAPVFDDLVGGEYAILVVDSEGCQIQKTTNLPTLGTINLTLSEKVEVESGTNFQIPLKIKSDGVGVQTVEWSPKIGLSCYDCEQPNLTDFKSRKYEVTVIDENDCVKTANILVQIKQPILSFQPTVFSPNADGRNDFFAIFPNKKLVHQIQSFSISDRYGNLIFNQKNSMSIAEKNGWNGRYKGKLMPVGAYIYWAVLELKNGETQVINGVVNLIR